ncbi:MAG: LPP20 family lipoprotein [Candidatus Sericytochromatia bacterium]
MKSPRLFSLLLASALTLGTVSLVSVPTSAQVVQTIGAGQVDWTNGQITVTGTGAAPSNTSQSAGQKRLLAQRAAVADAYRQLAELINGVTVTSETLVKDFVVESDIVKTRVEALIKGARVGKPRYLSDGTVEIDVTLGVYGQNSLSSVLIPPALAKVQEKPQQQMPDPRPTVAPDITTQPVTGTYSGVIIDCRGLGVKPGMSPQIIDSSGREIYIGDRPIDPDLVVNIGIVGYAETLPEAQANARVGNKPLVIKAVKAGGRFKTDAIIAADKGQALMQADSSSDFFSKSKVIFIVDK